MPLYLLFVIAFPLGMLWVETRPNDGPTICMFRQTTHLDCPSCGLTRAFRAMGRLDVRAATRYNPLGPAVFLGALAYWSFAIAMLLTHGQVRLPAWWRRRQTGIFWGVIIIYLLFGIGRIMYELRHPPPPPQPLPYSSGWYQPHFVGRK